MSIDFKWRYYRGTAYATIKGFEVMRALKKTLRENRQSQKKARNGRKFINYTSILF